MTMIPVYKMAGSEAHTPYGLFYISAALRMAGYDTHIDMVEDSPGAIEAKAQEAVAMKPGFVGISSVSFEFYNSILLARRIKEIDPSVIVVLGGIHPTIQPRESLRSDCFDYIVIGEGEKTVVELADFLVRGRGDRTRIKGLGYRVDGKPVINEKREIMTAEEMDRHVIDLSGIQKSKYTFPRLKYKRQINIIVSRGCNLHCTFCYNSAVYGRNFRVHSLDYVRHLVDQWREVDPDFVVFQDDHLFSNQEKALEVLRLINLPSRVCVTVNEVTEDFVQRLVDLKVEEVMIGWESGNDRLLRLVGKPFKTTDVVRALEIFSKHPRLTVSGSGIILLPTETKEETEQTMQFALRLSEFPNFMTVVGGYLPYPGAPLTNLAVKQGFKFPADVREWKVWSRYEIDQLDYTWITWLDDKYKKKLRRFFYSIRWVSTYFQNEEFFPKWKIVFGRIFSKLQRLRIRYGFYHFPIEHYLYWKVWHHLKELRLLRRR